MRHGVKKSFKSLWGQTAVKFFFPRSFQSLNCNGEIRFNSMKFYSNQQVLYKSVTNLVHDIIPLRQKDNCSR